MKLLVTGAEGQVAKSLVEAGTTSVEVVAVGRPVLDLTCRETIAAAIAAERPDVLINAAAYTAVDKSESEPELAQAVNAAGAEHAAAEARAAGIPIIHISTDYVFDGSKDGPYVETDRTSPVSAYGRSKLAGEQAVALGNPQHLILRTAWVHSPFGNNFVKTMLRLAESRDVLGVVDDQHGSPSYAPHLAAVILQMAEQILQRGADQVPWGVYHAVGAGETTWCQLAREVFRVSSNLGGPGAEVNPIATSDYPTPAHRPANSRLSGEKLEREFGLSFPHWREGVEACVRRLLQSDRTSAARAE